MTTSAAGMAEGEFALAKTSVWWDIENCQVPRRFDAHKIAQNISAALANEGYRGMVSSIYAYGDANNINSNVQHALNSTGVNLNHVPAGVKDATDKKILVDMLLWAVDNPPPANYLLISGDRDFSNALHQLRLRRYNILLAHSPNMSQALVAAAKCVWFWSTLLEGGPPRNTESSHKDGAIDTDSGNPSEGLEQTQNAHGNTDTGSSLVAGGPPRNAESSLKSGARDTDTGNPSEGLLRANGNGNHEDWKPVKLIPKALKKSKRPTPGMQDKRNGSPEKKTIKANHLMQQTDQVSTTDQVSEVRGNAQSKNNAGNVAAPSSATFSKPDKEARSLKSLSHKFYANNSVVCTGPMRSTSSSISELASNSGNNQVRPGPASRPNEKNSAQPPFAPPGNLRASSSLGNSFYPQPRETNRPPFEIPPQTPQAERPPFRGPSASLPDISRLNLSELPIGVQQRPISYQHNPEMRPIISGTLQNSTPVQNFGHFPPGRPEYRTPAAINGNTYNTGFSGGQAFPGPTPKLQFHMDTISHALDILRIDKMAPAETNIGETEHPNFNVRLGLDYAMRHQMIVKQSSGNSLPLYIQKNDRLWNCVNIMDANAKHPKKTWNTVQKYMSSPIGRAVLFHTNFRYEAAMVLKPNCFKNLPLGIVLFSLDHYLKFRLKERHAFSFPLVRGNMNRQSCTHRCYN